MLLLSRHRTKNAVRFKEKELGNIWMIMGKTSVWGDPDAPPSDDPATTAVTEAFCAVPATMKWIKENPGSGSIQFVDANRTIRYFDEATTRENAISVGATQVLLTADVSGADLEVLATKYGFTQFRQIGFVTDLIPAGYHAGTVGVSGNTVTGVDTLWTFASLLPSMKIGFGSQLPHEITTWYTISSINNDDSITLVENAGSIDSGTDYVIRNHDSDSPLDSEYIDLWGNLEMTENNYPESVIPTESYEFMQIVSF